MNFLLKTGLFCILSMTFRASTAMERIIEEGTQKAAEESQLLRNLVKEDNPSIEIRPGIKKTPEQLATLRKSVAQKISDITQRMVDERSRMGEELKTRLNAINEEIALSQSLLPGLEKALPEEYAFHTNLIASLENLADTLRASYPILWKDGPTAEILRNDPEFLRLISSPDRDVRQALMKEMNFRQYPRDRASFYKAVDQKNLKARLAIQKAEDAVNLARGYYERN